jgi:hypothetical protein
MGLLDSIDKAVGTPTANYARKGRHIVKITRVSFSEGGLEDKPNFRVDGQVIHSYLTDDPHQPGETVTVSEGMKFPASGMARTRRALAAMASLDESEVTPAKAKELVGPKQPCVGSVVAFELLERTSKEKKTPYTVFEICPLNDQDSKELDTALAS